MAGEKNHRTRNVLLVVLGLAIGSFTIRLVAPTPHIRHISEKLAHLENDSQGYDILFAGSSRVFRQISPKVFGRRLGKHNISLRSFNFGIPAARSVEVWHLLKRLESETSIRPRFVVIEPDGLLVHISRENVGNEREVYWHAPAETALAIRSVQDLKISTRARMSALHAEAFFFRGFGIGRLRLLVSQAVPTGVPRSHDATDLGPDGDGWVPFTKSPGQAEFDRRQDFLEHIPRYHWMVGRLTRLNSKEACLSTYQAEMLTNLKTAIENLGAQPVFILSPQARPRCEVHQAYRDGILPNLLAFDDASKYPGLYDIEQRFDYEHLNTRGAKIYSRLLADRFARYLNDHEDGGEK